MTLQSHQTNKRKPWDSYFLDIAYMVATRSTCNRKKVGAVIVDSENKHIVSTGYNGSLPKAEHCVDAGCHMVDNHCTRTVHAETNAINQAAKMGVKLHGKTIYCTTKPCWNCFKNIIQAGITSIYYKEDYQDGSSVLYKKYLKQFPNITLRSIT